MKSMYQCTAQFTTLHGLRVCDDIIVRHWETLYNNREHIRYSRRVWIVCFIFVFPWRSFFQNAFLLITMFKQNKF